MTDLRCGGIFKYDFVANLPLSLPVKEFWKSVNMKDIRLLEDLSSAIRRTFVRYFARYQLTWRVARSLDHSRAFCFVYLGIFIYLFISKTLLEVRRLDRF